MQENKLSAYNLFFIIPFLIWVIGGGILLLSYDKEALFSAVNIRHTSFLDICMFYATWLGEGIVITLVLLVLSGARPLRNWWYFITALLCNSVPALVVQGVKHVADAPRPLKYFNKAAWVHHQSHWPILMEHSFPSGHSAGAFSFFVFITMLLPRNYKGWGFLFFCLALLVGYSRIYLAAHFFADVYVGSIIGTVVAIVVFNIMLPYRKKVSLTTSDI